MASGPARVHGATAESETPGGRTAPLALTGHLPTVATASSAHAETVQTALGNTPASDPMQPSDFSGRGAPGATRSDSIGSGPGRRAASPAASDTSADVVIATAYQGSHEEQLHLAQQQCASLEKALLAARNEAAHAAERASESEHMLAQLRAQLKSHKTKATKQLSKAKEQARAAAEAEWSDLVADIAEDNEKKQAKLNRKVKKLKAHAKKLKAQVASQAEEISQLSAAQRADRSAAKPALTVDIESPAGQNIRGGDDDEDEDDFFGEVTTAAEYVSQEQAYTEDSSDESSALQPEPEQMIDGDMKGHAAATTADETKDSTAKTVHEMGGVMAAVRRMQGQSDATDDQAVEEESSDSDDEETRRLQLDIEELERQERTARDADAREDEEEDQNGAGGENESSDESSVLQPEPEQMIDGDMKGHAATTTADETKDSTAKTVREMGGVMAAVRRMQGQSDATDDHAVEEESSDSDDEETRRLQLEIEELERQEQTAQGEVVHEEDEEEEGNGRDDGRDDESAGADEDSDDEEIRRLQIEIAKAEQEESTSSSDDEETRRLEAEIAAMEEEEEARALEHEERTLAAEELELAARGGGLLAVEDDED
jgi:hypothetical protein